MLQIHVVLIVVLCFVYISNAASDDSATSLHSLQNSLTGRRRMRPLPKNSDADSLASVIMLDEEGFANQDNETSIIGDQRMGDYENSNNEKDLSNQFSMSMSYTLSVSSTTKSAKKAKSTKASDGTTSPSFVTTTTTSKKAKSSKSSPSPGEGEIPDNSSTSKNSKKGRKKRKSSKVGASPRIYEGRFVQLRDYKKSCTSSGSCVQSNGANCKGGMDVVQDFSVRDFGDVTIHLDFAWDFSRQQSTCGPVSRKEETLLGIGWLPMISNSYVCYTDHVYRIPKSPNMNPQVFTSTFEMTLPDGQVLDGQILGGAVCELFTESDVYLDMNSYVIVAVVPGYSVIVRYDIDERTMQVVDFLTGAPQITIQQDDSYQTGYWDHLRPDPSVLLNI